MARITSITRTGKSRMGLSEFDTGHASWEQISNSKESSSPPFSSNLQSEGEMSHQRTIQSAVFDAPRGELTVGALMAMEPAAWEHLRSEINLRRSSAPDRPLARCLICQSSVYIKAQATAAGNVPLFAHYAEAKQDCPWYQGKPLIPDEVRGAQYIRVSRNAPATAGCATQSRMCCGPTRARRKSQ